ncbi:FG-GAP repeat domain-containing protein, partial [Paenibacillus sonchi]
GSEEQILADVNGDGKSDAVIVNHGSWYVSITDGERFTSYDIWISGYGFGSKSYLLADIDGDHKAEAIVIYPNESWYVWDYS